MLVALAVACNLPVSPRALPPEPATPTISAAGATDLSIEPTLSLSTAEAERLVSELTTYGVTVADSPGVQLRDLQVVRDGVVDLAHSVAGPYSEAAGAETDAQSAFQLVFGPTLFRLYPDRETVDGINYAINCGWEGRFANGCQHTGIYPEQEFPTQQWLILIAAPRLHGVTTSEGHGLVMHELVHNLTWGDGHNPDNIGGFSYVRFVGDDFALTYMDAFGVQAGRDAYWTESARESNPLWRAELTADAVASWASNAISGPYVDSITTYIYDMLVCELRGDASC